MESITDFSKKITNTLFRNFHPSKPILIYCSILLLSTFLLIKLLTPPTRVHANYLVNKSIVDAAILLLENTHVDNTEQIEKFKCIHNTIVSVESEKFIVPVLMDNTYHQLEIEQKVSIADYNKIIRIWTNLCLKLEYSFLTSENKNFEIAIKILENSKGFLYQFFNDDLNDKFFLLKTISYKLGELYKIKAENNKSNRPELFILYHRKAIDVYEEMIILQDQKILQQKQDKKITQQEQVKLKRDPRLYHYRGWSYYRLGKFDNAKKNYDEALKIAPNYAKVLLNKMLLLEKSGTNEFGKHNDLIEKAYRITYTHWNNNKSNPAIPFTLALLESAFFNRPTSTGLIIDKKERRITIDSILNWLKIAFTNDPKYSIRSKEEYWLQPIKEKSESFSKRLNELITSYHTNPDEFIE